MRSDERGRIDALMAEFVEDGEHIARRRQQHLRLEIGDQPHLALGHARGDRHDGHAEPLGAVMCAEPAGKEAVAIGNMTRMPAGNRRLAASAP